MQEAGGGGDKPKAPNTLPSLDNLVLDELKSDPKTVDKLKTKEKGFYCLDMHALKNLLESEGGVQLGGKDCESSIFLIPKAIDDPDIEPLMEQMAEFMTNEELVPTSRSKPWNKPIRRKQCTFGAYYKNFGNSFELNDGRVPELVHRVYDKTIDLISNNRAASGIERDQDPKSVYTGVHCNFYDGGKANVPAHQDNEPELDLSKPIFSYTFLKEKVAGKGVQSRQFNIYNQNPARGSKIKPVASVLLGHGDLLIMAGKMQTYFWHEVPIGGEKTFENTQRINFTVRAFTADAVAAGKRAAEFRKEQARLVEDADRAARAKASEEEDAAKAKAEEIVRA